MTSSILFQNGVDTVGFSLSGRILFVVYTIRRIKMKKKTIRIISARQATRKERQAYAG